MRCIILPVRKLLTISVFVYTWWCMCTHVAIHVYTWRCICTRVGECFHVCMNVYTFFYNPLLRLIMSFTVLDSDNYLIFVKPLYLFWKTDVEFMALTYNATISAIKGTLYKVLSCLKIWDSFLTLFNFYYAFNLTFITNRRSLYSLAVLDCMKFCFSSNILTASMYITFNHRCQLLNNKCKKDRTQQAKLGFLKLRENIICIFIYTTLPLFSNLRWATEIGFLKSHFPSKTIFVRKIKIINSCYACALQVVSSKRMNHDWCKFYAEMFAWTPHLT